MKTITHTCPKCGKVFTVEVGDTGKDKYGNLPRTYCSFNCSNSKITKTDETKFVHCVVCGKKEEVHKHSPEITHLCDKHRKKARVKKTKERFKNKELFRCHCPICKKQQVTKVKLTKPVDKLCSTKCRKAYAKTHPPKGYKDIRKYMQKSLKTRKKHIDLSQPCINVGTENSKRNHKNLAAFLKVTPPSGRILVCHACNNKYCVNMYHVYFGTDRENLVIDGMKFGTLHLQWAVKKRKAKEKREERKRLKELAAKESAK